MKNLDLAALRELWPRAAFVAFDFETTGLDGRNDRIVEIGALRFGPDGEGEAFQTLVDPGRPIPWGASRVNGITDAMVRGQGDLETALPRFLAFAGGAVLVAHNAPFDLGFLKAGLARLGLKAPANPTVDTCALARLALPGRPSYSLQNLARDFRVDPGSAHRALDDARVCARLVPLIVAGTERA